MMKKQKVFAVVLAMNLAIPWMGYAQTMDKVFEDLDFFMDGYLQSEAQSLPQGMLPTAVGIGVEQSANISAYAYAQLGKTYRYGAYGPQEFDCSGLIFHVFSLTGKKIPRTSQAQSEVGIPVEKEHLMVGDIVFFDTRHSGDLSNIAIDTEDIPLFAEVEAPSPKTFVPSKVTHNGIYIGEGKFIHASSGSVMKVVVEDLDSKYFAQRYLFARRYEGL